MHVHLGRFRMEAYRFKKIVECIEVYLSCHRYYYRSDFTRKSGDALFTNPTL